MTEPPPVDIVDRYPAIRVVEVDDDTCDHCPAEAHVQAYVYAEFAKGSISLCGHCATAGWEKLTAQAVTIIDLRHLITP